MIRTRVSGAQRTLVFCIPFAILCIGLVGGLRVYALGVVGELKNVQDHSLQLSLEGDNLKRELIDLKQLKQPYAELPKHLQKESKRSVLIEGLRSSVHSSSVRSINYHYLPVNELVITDAKGQGELSFKRETAIVKGTTPHSVSFFNWLNILGNEFDSLEIRGCKLQRDISSVATPGTPELDFECMLSWYYVYAV